MIVARVKREMESRGRATVSQLAAELGESPDRVVAAMEVHIRKGRIRVESGGGTTHCSTVGCTRCPLSDACRLGEQTDGLVDVFVWTR